MKETRYRLTALCLLFYFLSQAAYAQMQDDDLLIFLPGIIAAANKNKIKNGVYNGWYVNPQKEVIWGNAAYNSWWRLDAKRPNLTRNAGDQYEPLKTVEFPKLVNAMLQYGYPGFYHNYGLWYDRRRDSHDTDCRNNDNIISPVL